MFSILNLIEMHRHIVHRILKYDSGVFVRKDELDEANTNAANEIFGLVLNFEQHASENNYECMLVFHPIRTEVINGKYHESLVMEDFFKRIKKESNTPMVDLLRFYTEEKNMNPDNVFEYFWKVDNHHNARGYELFATGVEQKILQEGLINPTP